jgi:hypothetical protein
MPIDLSLLNHRYAYERSGCSGVITEAVIEFILER